MVIYRVNGVDLATLSQRIETGEDLLTANPLIGDDVVLPDRDGALDPYVIGQRRRADGSGRWAPHLWLKGVDPVTGAIGPDGSEQDYLENVDAILRLFHARSLTVEAERPNGDVRSFVGHLAPGESLDFTRERSSPVFGRYIPSVAIPGAHWIGSDLITVGPLTLSSGAAVDLSAFGVATAVCTDLEVTFGGGKANPRLELDSGYLAWTSTIASGKSLLVNTGTGVIDDGPGTAWTPSYSFLDYSPGPRFFELDPTGDMSGVFTFTGGGTMTLTISGYPRYRTS